MVNSSKNFAFTNQPNITPAILKKENRDYESYTLDKLNKMPCSDRGTYKNNSIYCNDLDRWIGPNRCSICLTRTEQKN